MALTVLTEIGSDMIAQQFSFRNRIINGDMRVDQRNVFAQQIITTANVTIGTYTCDRWSVIATGNSVAGKANSSGYNFTGNTGLTALSFLQRIEANNVQDWLGTTVSLQAKISASTLTSITWNAYYPNNALDAWGTAANNINFANGTFTINTTPTVYTTSFTVNSSCSNGLGIYFTTGALGLANTLVIKDVQLESGSVPSNFERLMMGHQLRECQRYFQKSNVQGTAPGTASGASGTGAIYHITAVAGVTWLGGHRDLPVIMRAVPTMVMYDDAGTANRVSFQNSSATWANGIAAGQPGYGLNGIYDNSFSYWIDETVGVYSISAHYTATAEL